MKKTKNESKKAQSVKSKKRENLIKLTLKDLEKLQGAGFISWCSDDYINGGEKDTVSASSVDE